MNKKILSILALAGLGLFATSCADEDLGPVVTFDTAGKGAYVRLLEDNGNLLVNLLDLSQSEYVYSVEFVDLEQGDLVSEYRIDLVYQDRNTDNGDNSSGPNEIMSWSASEFVESERGFKSVMDISITPDDLFRTAGVDASTVKAGDRFVVKGTLTLEDGSTFTADNSTAAVNGSAFAGHFDFVLSAGCPSDLTGTFDFVGSNFWCGAADNTGSVTINALGGGSYSFSDWSFGAYPACYGGNAAGWGTLAFTDVCEEVSFTGRTDNYGDTWTFTSSLSDDGTEWTINWVNTYGEAGTGTVINPAGWDFVLAE
ncbi:hypothetical protein [Flavilitoribacter nigricans]|uniref:Lipoprotein n=1 Tax=Flavilitoribacter nigricans (strain ATCC 23147 / DSM 23189 / NBRC 102662 / NCIMB 1420 / SS-2) TaxID=1122177 RepID=A0A2D0NFN9_FLAN2|nr:hypothetical protein [Flavilitoribacter nigricans]PHN07228.1 hypothetical protein CRP01_08380 [Flavilitoribacter nigricans DSM 23189 = NBRC 102662]